MTKHVKDDLVIKRVNLFFVDSFTDKKFFGNQAPVIIDADELTRKEKSAMAREFNASETIFVSRSGIADFKIQFFTPKHEVEICGHGTIAALWVLSSIGRIGGIDKVVRIKQETKAGVLPVDIYFDREGKPAKVMMHQESPRFIDGDFDKQMIAEILRINPECISDRYPVQNVSTGRAKLMIPICSKQKLHQLNPNFAMMKEFCCKIETNGFHVFTFDTLKKSSITTARHFAPTAGVSEDPVTGNAAGALGCFLIKYCKDKVGKRDHYYFIMEQGSKMQRDGKVCVEIDTSGERFSVKVGGKASILFNTSFYID